METMKRSYTAAGDNGQYREGEGGGVCVSGCVWRERTGGGVCVCGRVCVTLKVRTRVMRQIYYLGGRGAYTNLR